MLLKDLVQKSFLIMPIYYNKLSTTRKRDRSFSSALFVLSNKHHRAIVKFLVVIHGLLCFFFFAHIIKLNYDILTVFR